MGVCRLHLVEGDDAETCILSVGRVRKGDCERPYGSCYKTLTTCIVRDTIGPLAALLRRLLINLPCEIVEHLVIDDLLVESGVFASAMFARVVDEELALGNAGGAEGVGLNNVCAGLEKAAMNVADHLRLGEGEEIAVVEQVLGRVLE